MHSTGALMLFALASVGPHVGSVEGAVKVVQDGSPIHCLGVWLIRIGAELPAGEKVGGGLRTPGLELDRTRASTAWQEIPPPNCSNGPRQWRPAPRSMPPKSARRGRAAGASTANSRTDGLIRRARSFAR